jgi:hypothetical protein
MEIVILKKEIEIELMPEDKQYIDEIIELLLTKDTETFNLEQRICKENKDIYDIAIYNGATIGDEVCDYLIYQEAEFNEAWTNRKKNKNKKLFRLLKFIKRLF